ncbi:hypothetical protein HYS30_01860 [Candidatus Peregrinibacteria bacterium]|nr:hypothetical protein [Candidatus Peregrinibacteria bacterium]
MLLLAFAAFVVALGFYWVHHILDRTAVGVGSGEARVLRAASCWLCKAGVWVAGMTAWYAVIYWFLLQ